MVKRAHQEGRRLHIPRVLLSTSVEFQAANSQQPPHEPALNQISAEDPRIKQNPWYQDGLKTPPPEVENGKPTPYYI
jgi:hypothetical protein